MCHVFVISISDLIIFFREVASEARLNSELELQKTGHRPTIRPYTCGQCLCCGDSCGCHEVNDIL